MAGAGQEDLQKIALPIMSRERQTGADSKYQEPEGSKRYGVAVGRVRPVNLTRKGPARPAGQAVADRSEERRDRGDHGDAHQERVVCPDLIRAWDVALRLLGHMPLQHQRGFLRQEPFLFKKKRIIAQKSALVNVRALKSAKILI